MKFSQAIEAYNKAIDNEVNISSNNKIELYDSTVQEAIAKKMTSALGYIDFLLDRDK